MEAFVKNYRRFLRESSILAASKVGIVIVVLPIMTLALTSCISTEKRKAGADTEVYNILGAKSPAVPGIVDDFDIDPAEPRILDGFPVNQAVPDYLGIEAQSEVGAAIITLDEALEIAFTQNRDYQTRKERLYLQALSLTLDRHQFAPIFSAGKIVQVDQFSDDSTLLSGRNGSAGVVKLLRGGGQLALNLTSSFTEWLSGGGTDSVFSTLSGSFVQPLLRGAGRDVNTEFLTQGERNVLYELRNFTRFRKIFAVDVADFYYRVLQSRDNVSNIYDNLQSSILSFERVSAFQQVGQRRASEVARSESQKLRAESGWTRSIVTYQRDLDNFKILLGFATDASLVLDDDELDALEALGLQDPSFATVEEGIELALVTRLDLNTDQDRVDDAFRRIKVAANGLKADLDFFLRGTVRDLDEDRFASFDFASSQWTAGVDLNLPLDRKRERNDYRRALIDYELSKRSADLATDTVKLQVRNAWRSLQQAKTDYAINLLDLSVNLRRVEEETIRAEEGIEGASVIDQVDAQNDLTAAQTALTGALVQHTISLLELWRDVGILYVEKNGQWEETLDV